MTRYSRLALWLEAAGAVLTGVWAALTVAWPDWIERALGVDPDGHSGSLEWLIVAGLLLTTARLALLARSQRRHA